MAHNTKRSWPLTVWPSLCNSTSLGWSTTVPLLPLTVSDPATVLFVTHSIEEAIIVGSRILVLSPHPGRVRAELDASKFGSDDVDSPGFGALSKRIHSLLFGHSPNSPKGHDDA